MAALSIEFVAKPQEAAKVHSVIPSAVAKALGEVTGFAGCFVFIANHEARLVTVVTLWTGADRVNLCGQNAKWVRALLKPYLDRCLRVQTLSAFIPAIPEARHGLHGATSTADEEVFSVQDEALQLA